MINKIENKKELKKFVYLIKELYNDHSKYVYPIFSSVKKELEKVVLDKKTYTAILCEKDSQIVGRLLYTVDYSKHKKENIGYFSFFDCINDDNAAAELFSYMENDLKDKVNYIEGTYSPYDPDTRRGILVKGFDEDHTILTSYNYEYYEKLLSFCGYGKAYDTYTVKIPFTDKNFEMTKNIGERVLNNYDVRVDELSAKHLDRDIQDIFQILQIATTELNYQEAPSIKVIEAFVKNVKHLLNFSLIKIARENHSNKPIGFCVALPDFNQVLAKTKGKINPFAFLAMKNKISSARGILQYVIPEYQKKGLIVLIYYKMYESFIKYNITKFEGGTILEKNTDSWGALVKMGGEISKIYRIMGKSLCSIQSSQSSN